MASPHTVMPTAKMPSGAPVSFPPPPGAIPMTPPPRGPPGIADLDLPTPKDMPVAASLGQRVNSMLAAATMASESQVGAELRRLETAFSALASKASRVELLLGQRDEASRGSPVLQDTFGHVLADVEQRWEQEIKDVKRELHQTILAHNHNADLMADHKVAIDKIRNDIEILAPPEKGPSTAKQQEELRQHLELITSTLAKNDFQDQDIENLLQRGEAICQRASGLTAAAAAAASQAAYHQHLQSQALMPGGVPGALPSYPHGMAAGYPGPPMPHMPHTYPHDLSHHHHHLAVAAAGHAHAQYPLPHGLVP